MKLLPRHFKNWLDAYLEHTDNSEAPTPMRFWTGVSTIAGALRRRVWIEQQAYQWTPNFYIILVGPPGVATKSTAIRAGTKLLRKVPNIHFGPDSLTWQFLTTALEDACELVPVNPDASFEERIMLPMSCITCSVKELGTLLDPQDRKFMDVLTSLWDGQLENWGHGTKTQGETNIENPWVNIIGATTPSWLKDNMPGGMIHGGFASRVIFIYGERKHKLIAYPSRHKLPGDYKETERKLVEDLKEIAKLVGEYKLTEDAMDAGEIWYDAIWNKRPDHLASERFGGYFARKQGHIHKLAIVLAAAQRDELVINKDDLAIAFEIVTSLEDKMLHILQSFGASETSKYLVELLAYLRVLKKMDKQNLWREFYSVMTALQFAEALDGGIKAGYIKVINHGEGDICYITKDGLEMGTKERDEQAST